MIIECQEHYDKVVEYAKKINNNSLQQCLERLQAWEKNPNCKCTIELYKDFDPYSFIFVQRYEDGTKGIVGGLIYHGIPDKSYSVTLLPTHGWQIHT